MSATLSATSSERRNAPAKPSTSMIDIPAVPDCADTINNLAGLIKFNGRLQRHRQQNWDSGYFPT